LKNTLPWDEILRILEAKTILNDGWLGGDIARVYGSDLMSDILSFSKPKSLLITGLINPQTIRTAEMVDIAAICFVHDKNPHDETLDLAKRNQIPLFRTRFSMFEACGRLFEAGLVDCEGDPGPPGSGDCDDTS
jgi:predicted transcriptional regulator